MLCGSSHLLNIISVIKLYLSKEQWVIWWFLVITKSTKYVKQIIMSFRKLMKSMYEVSPIFQLFCLFIWVYVNDIFKLGEDTKVGGGLWLKSDLWLTDSTSCVTDRFPVNGFSELHGWRLLLLSCHRSLFGYQQKNIYQKEPSPKKTSWILANWDRFVRR